MKLKRIPIFLLIFAILVFCGCTKNESEQITISESSQEDGQDTKDVSSTGEERYIVMMGRSVMQDWFNHWGWDGESPMRLDRYTLEYEELSPPPYIIDSVRGIMNELPENKKDIVFFKLCFDDFEGDDNAGSNLERNKKYIEDVYNIVVQEHGAKLIIGNALPKVIAQTDIYLVWNHQQYNSWLNDFWEEHPDDMTVFNMYDLVTNDLGATYEDLTISEDDSHLKDEAYNFFDNVFFDMLDNLY